MLTFFILNIGGVSTAAIVLLLHFVRQKEEAFGLLRAEQERSEHLLLNILPREIVPVLKAQPGTIANYYEGTSILFADIVSFTPWSVELAPKEMVAMLDEIFSHLDLLAERHGVEKIRTIGDNYMAAAGVPRPRTDHAHACARLALDMQAYIESMPPRKGRRLDFRIGINIRDHFLCEPRGCIEVKGKGEMETWYLLGAQEARGLGLASELSSRPAH